MRDDDRSVIEDYLRQARRHRDVPMILNLQDLREEESLILVNIQKNADTYISWISANFTRPAKLYLVLLDSGTFRIWAAKITESLFCVFVNYGTYLIINAIVSQLVSDERCPKQCHAPGRRFNPADRTEPAQTIFRHWPEWIQNQTRSLLTVKPDKYALATLLADHCINSLLRHECHHVLSGHLDQFQNFEYFEFHGDSSHSTHTLSALEFQVLEADADVGAAYGGFGFALRANDTTVPYPEMWRALQPTVTQTTYYWAYAQYLLMRLTAFYCDTSPSDEIRSLKEAVALRQHPPSAVRFYQAQGCAGAYAASHQHGYLSLTMSQMFISATFHVDFSLQLIYGLPSDPLTLHGLEFSQDVSGNSSRDYCTPYLEMLNVARMRLEPVLNRTALIPIFRREVNPPETL